MDATLVQYTGTADIDQLVQQLRQHHELHSAKLRCLLLLLRDGVNTSPYHIFSSGSSPDLVVIVIARTAPDFSAVGMFAPEESSCVSRLEVVLRYKEMRSALWRSAFKVDALPMHLFETVGSAAREFGFQWDPIPVSSTQIMFVRPASSASLPECLPSSGLTVRPLDLRHEDTLRHFWRYAHYHPDLDMLLHDGLRCGISAGVFTAEGATSGAAQLVSWAILHHNGHLGFLHTVPAYRRRGLASLALAESTRRCAQSGYPCVAGTGQGSTSVIRMLEELGYVRADPAIWGTFWPSPGNDTLEEHE